MTPATRDILLNKEVIDVDQDPRGAQATPIKQGNLETWIKALADGGAAIGVVNLGSETLQATVRAGELHLHGGGRRARPVAASRRQIYQRCVQRYGALARRADAQAQHESE